MIQTLLIANRGEIACRIIATARKMGLRTVAVYSDADASARHVRMADAAAYLGGNAPADSYLSIPKIIEAARTHGADAVHPGYGFLSENPDFVEALEAEGLTFVGPSAQAIRAMGLKDRAKALMEEAGVPIVPGHHGEAQDDATLAKAAQDIGYPVLIKAVAGGGGKGMRLVEAETDFGEALASARAEARTAFGNDAVLIEKFIQNPRHIEVQVFGDGEEAVHLFERDCSLQRRHQKVIEEAPAPGMTVEVRNAMGDAATRAARAIGYKGAGTVEFIVDGSGPLRTDGFWFMEMNTRLQVEHPVTEAITGVDLVEWQLRVAGGEPLPKSQEELTITGHAFEARLYAEDVPAGFLPAIGTLAHLEFPAGVRADTGVETGDAITPHYDPMIAKVITHGPDRETALKRLSDGLAQTQVAGTTTNLSFLGALTRHKDFAAGRVDTGLIARDLDALTTAAAPTPQDLAQAAMELTGLTSAQDALAGFTLHTPLTRTVTLVEEEVKLTSHDADHVTCTLGDTKIPAARVGQTWHYAGHASRPAHVHGRSVTLFGAEPITLTKTDPLDRVSAGAGGDVVLSPMPGLLRDVHVDVGDEVEEGAALATLEAMKMEHTLRAPRAGRIARLHAAAGAQVQAGVTLIELEPEDG